MTTIPARPAGPRSQALSADPRGRRPSPHPEPAPKPGYRPELQGLRAVAIGMVVVYHLFFDRVSGGVDIFLLISAFLLTGTFADRLERGDPLRIGRFWIRAFKRLLPPAVATVLGVLLLMRLFFPAFRWREILAQALASTLYYENWYLATSAVDYYATDRAMASPLQHFWSLSIQGQVFVVWPLLFALAAVVARRTGRAIRPTLAVIFGTVFVVSLAWSTWSTANAQAYAYFDTFARLWEFALGSLLAIGLPVLERRWGFGPSVGGPRDGGHPLQAVRVVAGWVGLAGILSCGFVIDVEGAFPGWVALWPLASACLVIAAGRTGTRWGVDHWLSSAPLRRLGDMSYGLYLVHWPLLVTLLVVQGAPGARLLEGAILIALALRLGWLLTRYVDDPVRRARSLDLLPGRAVLVILLAVALGTTPVLGVRRALDDQAARALASSAVNNPGAAVLTGASTGPRDADAPVIPLPQDVLWDWVSLDTSCAGRLEPADPVLAQSCSMSAEGEPHKVIVVVGNSRVQQLMGALVPLAQQRGFQVVALLRGGCAFAFEGVDDACRDWNSRVADYLLDIQPRAVFTTSTFVTERTGEIVLPGFDAVVGQLTGAGIDVIGVRDQPRMPMHPIACVSDRTLDQCTVPTRGMFAATDINGGLSASATGDGDFHAVDLTPWICPDGLCSPVIGNVFVYLDAAHLTHVYARTLAPALADELTASGWSW